MFLVYLGGLLMKKIITCSVLASAALATPAFAQDEADKGMYFQLRTGVADLNNPDFAIIDTWSEPNNRLDTKLNTKSAATFGGDLGYDFGGVRVGLELAYQRNKVKGITLKSLNGTAITAEDLSDVVEGLGELDIISVDDLDGVGINGTTISATNGSVRSEEHTSELQSLMRISYAVFCLKKKQHKPKPAYQT